MERTSDDHHVSVGHLLPDRAYRGAPSDVASAPESALLHHRNVPWSHDGSLGRLEGMQLPADLRSCMLYHRIRGNEEDAGSVYFTLISYKL